MIEHLARVVIAGVLLLASTGAVSKEAIPGPVSAYVLRIVDGDTIEVRARIWLGLDKTILVRLSGVDAPELRGKCDKEKKLAVRAKKYVERQLMFIEPGLVVLRNIQRGKFAGRVVARVFGSDGTDLANRLIEVGLARSYGGGKRLPWCAGQ